MPVFSTLATAGPWHVLAFGALFGTQFFQTFIGGVVAYKVLPRPMFSHLQQKIFPFYFTLQSVLPALLLATHPTACLPSLFTPSSPHFYNTTVPLLFVISSSVLNLAVVRPATTKVMKERKAQETKESKKYYDEGPKSEAMKKLNSMFGRIHGVSGLLNLVGFLGAAAYGIVLGSNLKL